MTSNIILVALTGSANNINADGFCNPNCQRIDATTTKSIIVNKLPSNSSNSPVLHLLQLQKHKKVNWDKHKDRSVPYLTLGVSYTLSAEATIMGPMHIPDVPGGQNNLLEALANFKREDQCSLLGSL